MTIPIFRQQQPTAANNSQISTSLTQPAAGWTVKAADAIGYVIITSGDVQLNQTNSGLEYKIYNWGGGTNISDSGCKYVFVDSENSDEPFMIPDPVLTIVDITTDGRAPYKVPDADAEPVLNSTRQTTVAIECTPVSGSSTSVYAAVTDTTANRFFSLAMPYDWTGVGVRYIGLNNVEGWWTQGILP